jgi:glycolate oxidase FAD binding subunit
LLERTGVISYHPEELIITVQARTPIQDIQTELLKHQQTLPFFINNPHQSIGAAYALGGSDLSDSVLSIQLIDGRGDLLNFGAQVMKNVAGYDVARLLVGSRGQCGIIIQISFKVIPCTYLPNLSPPIQHPKTALAQEIALKIKHVFDPKHTFI